jgi:hypothetical protein
VSVKARVLQAIADELEARAPVLEGMAGGTVSVTVKLDIAGCPRKITLAAECETVVERKRPVSLVQGWPIDESSGTAVEYRRSE